MNGKADGGDAESMHPSRYVSNSRSSSRNVGLASITPALPLETAQVNNVAYRKVLKRRNQLTIDGIGQPDLGAQVATKVLQYVQLV